MRRSILNRVANPTSNILDETLANALEKVLKKESTQPACSSGHATKHHHPWRPDGVIDIDALRESRRAMREALASRLKATLESFTSRISQPPSMSLKLLSCSTSVG